MNKSENVKLNKLQNNNIFCIFVDIRNSTFLNKKYLEEKKEKKLLEIYQSFLNESYKIFNDNGFKNIQIQGDGIFGLFQYKLAEKRYTNICKCIRELLTNNNDLYKRYEIITTISVNFGKEIYSAFGLKNNRNKQLAYFGNVVSITKKMNSLSFKRTLLLISNKAWKILEPMKKNLKLENKPKQICLSIKGVEKLNGTQCWKKYNKK